MVGVTTRGRMVLVRFVPYRIRYEALDTGYANNATTYVN